MWNPIKIEKKGTYWLLYPGEGNGTIQLRPFPYELVPEVRDQHALLSSQGCTAAVSDMHFILKALLKGIFPLRSHGQASRFFVVLNESRSIH